jgi:hypothetical protein
MMKLPVVVSFLFVNGYFGKAFGFWGPWKRDASPSTLIVPITAANGKYSVNVNMVWFSLSLSVSSIFLVLIKGLYLQSSAFNLQLVFSTSTGWTVVAGAACYSCNGAPV